MKQTYFIVRGQSSGVFFGQIVSRNGSEVKLADAIRLWYWDGAASISQIAVEGVKAPENCKFCVPVDSLLVLDAIEIDECSDIAAKCIKGVKSWRE